MTKKPTPIIPKNKNTPIEKYKTEDVQGTVNDELVEKAVLSIKSIFLKHFCGLAKINSLKKSPNFLITELMLIETTSPFGVASVCVR